MASTYLQKERASCIWYLFSPQIFWPVNDDVVDLQEVGSLGDEKDELGGVQHDEVAVGDGD